MMPRFRVSDHVYEYRTLKEQALRLRPDLICTNARRLKEQALRLRPDPLITPTRTPVLLFDSKGLTLKEQVRINPVLNTELLWKKGATAEDRLGYLQVNLSQNLIRLNQITLFVWIGTCNLTTVKWIY